MINLALRIVSGLVLGALVLILILIGGWPAALIAAAAGAVACWEAGMLVGGVVKAVALPGAMLLIISPMLPSPAQAALLVLAAAIICALAAVTFLRQPVARAYATVFVTGYVGLGLGSFVAFLAGGHAGQGRNDLIAVILGIVACDTFAYAVGLMAGRHRLAPDISPKKSVEGAIGGLLGAAIALGIAGPLAAHMAIPWAVLLGLAVGVVAQTGDLAESWMKRQAGVKDSGTLIPGHGGLLDRLDSVLLVLPVAYLALRAAGRA